MRYNRPVRALTGSPREGFSALGTRLEALTFLNPRLEIRDVDAIVATMVLERYINNIPTTIGGRTDLT
jgi:hypothetical protein